MHNTGIYEIRNTINGKRYVGGSRNFGNRWRQHRQSLDRGDHHSKALLADWREHGCTAFEFKPILVCSEVNLLMYEQIALDHYRPEYNSSPTAGSQLGIKFGPEARARMSAANSRIGNPGYVHTPESKAKISASKTGVKLGAYDKERVSKTAAAMREVKSVLNEELVRHGKSMRASGASIQQVADEVGCTFHAAYDFLRGRTFKWVI